MTIIDIIMIITCILILLSVIVIERSDKMNKEEILEMLIEELKEYTDEILKSNEDKDLKLKDPMFIMLVNMKSISDVTGYYKRIEKKIKEM